MKNSRFSHSIKAKHSNSPSKYINVRRRMIMAVPLNGALGRLLCKFGLCFVVFCLLFWAFSQRQQSEVEVDKLEDRLQLAQEQLSSLHAQIDVITKHKEKIELLHRGERDQLSRVIKEQAQRIAHLEAENGRLGQALASLNNSNNGTTAKNQVVFDAKTELDQVKVKNEEAKEGGGGEQLAQGVVEPPMAVFPAHQAEAKEPEPVAHRGHLEEPRGEKEEEKNEKEEQEKEEQEEEKKMEEQEEDPGQQPDPFADEQKAAEEVGAQQQQIRAPMKHEEKKEEEEKEVKEEEEEEEKEKEENEAEERKTGKKMKKKKEPNGGEKAAAGDEDYVFRRPGPRSELIFQRTAAAANGTIGNGDGGAGAPVLTGRELMRRLNEKNRAKQGQQQQQDQVHGRGVEAAL